MIVKPKLDEREYKYILLNNGLQALLIQDKTVDKASASLDIAIGSFFDPEDTLGLAHFLEHMLFLGTKKYPQLNYYSNFLSKNSGNSNAYTSQTNTNYYFEVGHTAFESALDIFSEFFKSSLLSEEGVGKEVEAVDSEYRKNIPIVTRKVYAVLQELANQSHFYSKFSCGNRNTLMGKQDAVELMRKLRWFYDSFYSSDLMCLCVIGRESVEVLESWVEALFGGIVNKNLKQKELLKIPEIKIYPKESMGKLHLMKPGLKEVTRLGLQFEIGTGGKVDGWQTFWSSKPFQYLSNLIGHESEGSILSLLKEKGLATSLMAGGGSFCRRNAMYEVFNIQIELTREGVARYKEVLEVVFQYIEMLENVPVEKWIFDEKRQISEIMFEYQDKMKPSSYTSTLSSTMHEEYPKNMLLKGPYLMEEFNPGLISAMLKENFDVDNCFMLLISNDFNGVLNENVAWKNEKFYGSEYYSGISLPADYLNTLRKPPKVDQKLHLPPKNPFVPDKIVSEPVSPEKQGFVPPSVENLLQHERISLWYKQDRFFRQPKSLLYVNIKSPFAYSTPLQSVMTKLFCELFKDDLNQLSYLAEMAGMNFSIDAQVDGLLLVVNGFSDKFVLYFEKIYERLFKLFDEPEKMKQKISVYLEKLEKSYKNFPKESSLQQAMYYASYCIQNVLWTHGDKLKFLKGVNFESMKTFSQDFLTCSQVESFLIGSLKKDDAETLFELMKKLHQVDTLPHAFYYGHNRAHVIPRGKYAYLRKNLDELNPNNAVEYYLQTGSLATSKDRVLTLIAVQLLSEPAFHTLRTQEQLGYVVSVGLRKVSSQLGVRILVMSGMYDSVFIENRIEAFLNNFGAYLISGMPNEELAMHLNAVKQNLEKKDENMVEESSRWWSHIHSGFYEFRQIERDLITLRKITKEDVVNFYEGLIHPDSAQRSKLSIHVRNKSMPEIKAKVELEEDLKNNNQLIKDGLAAKYGLFFDDDELGVMINQFEMSIKLNEEGHDPSDEYDINGAIDHIAMRFNQENELSKSARVLNVVPTNDLSTKTSLMASSVKSDEVLPKGTVILDDRNINLAKEKWPLSAAPSPIDVSGILLKQKCVL